ncbi:MAG: peptidoglycan editing factor PgeF [Candidatus Heteroscillospira sp.]|jgi:YfiH family protein
MAFYESCVNGVPLIKSSLIPFRHGFTTRLGGVSSGYCESLNLGENRGDDPDCVRENYRRAAEAVGFDPGRLVYTRQVHGREVRYAAPEDSRELFTPIPYECDGLYTDIKDLPLVCYTADCVPVLLCDPEAGTAAAVHCGWRSTVADILGEAVKKLEGLGAKPGNIRAAIGPAIGACCFEVGADVTEAMNGWLGAAAWEFIREKPDTPGKYLADLRAADRYRLLELGLSAGHIDVSDECTMCAPDKFWSHRVTRGERGSQAAFIVI